MTISGQHKSPKTIQFNIRCLTRWALTEETPPGLSVKLIGAGGFPVHVVWVEEDQVGLLAVESRLDGRDGGSLVLFRWNSLSVSITLRWPSSLSDEDGLILVGDGVLEVAHLGGQKVSGLVSSGVRVEEWVRVDSAVVRLVAELWMVDGSDEGIDGDDWTVVASVAEHGAATGDSGHDLRWRLATLDKLVANRDGVDVVPVRTDRVDNLSNSVVKVANVKDTLEKLHAVTLRSSENVLDGVAVNTVGADVREGSSKLVKVLVDLISGLAGSIGVVWGIGDSITVSATWVLSDRVGDDILNSSWCWRFLDGCWWFVVSNCNS